MISVPASACVAVDKSAPDFRGDEKSLEAVREYFCLWQTSSKAHRYKRAYKCAMCAEGLDAIFFRCHDSAHATAEICEWELRNRRKRWITHPMFTHRTQEFASYCEPSFTIHDAIFAMEVRNISNGSPQYSQRKSLLKIASRVVRHQGRVSVHRPGRALRAGHGRMVVSN